MKSTILKVMVFSLVIFFFVLLFAEASGYYQTKDKKLKILTEEQVKVFEEDIAMGKKVDLNDYLIDNNIDYTNKVSNGFYRVSLKLEKGVDEIIKFIFKRASSAVNDS